MNIEASNCLRDILDDKIFCELKRKSILITGATGFIARYLVHAIVANNDKRQTNTTLYLLVRNQKKAERIYGNKIFNRSDIVFLYGDVCDELLLTVKVDFIIHAAGPSNPSIIRKNPVGVINANIRGTDNVLRYAVSNQIASVLFVSSITVYGENKGSVESFSNNPLDFLDVSNCYSISKQAGEMLCASYHEQYRLSTKIIRPSYVYGAGDEDDIRVWAEIIKKVSENRDITLQTNGLIFRPVIYVMDLILTMLYVLLKGKESHAYDAYSEIVSIRKFAEIATDLGFTKSKLLFANRADEFVKEKVIIDNRLESCGALELGWNPCFSLEKSIEDAVKIAINN